MSREAAIEFVEKVEADAGLRYQIEREPMPDAYVRLGRAAGFTFTTDELKAVLHARRFYFEAGQDLRLRQRLAAAQSEAAVLALAAARGFDCGIDDLRAFGPAAFSH